MNTATTTYAVDWGHGKKLVVFDGVECQEPDCSLLEFISRLTAGSRVVVESTWESWDKQSKNATIDLAITNGIILKTVHPRSTELYRRSHKLEKTDQGDARVIHALATEGVQHLASPRKALIKPQSRSEKLNTARRLEYPAELVATFLECLPTRTTAAGGVKITLPEDIRHALGDSWGILFQFVVYALDVLDAGGSREDYDRKVGAYAHGYNNIARSNIYYYRLRALVHAAVGDQTGLTGKELRDHVKTLPDEVLRPLRKTAMKAIRRATRWVFHEVRRRRAAISLSQTGTEDPATGTKQPSVANSSATTGTKDPATGTLHPKSPTPLRLLAHLATKLTTSLPTGTTDPATGTIQP